MSAMEKIRTLEIAPPDEVWSSLATLLAQSEADQNIAQKLNQTTSTPHPKIWNNINSNLSVPEQKSLHRSNPYMFRYAAVLIGLMLLGAFSYLFLIHFNIANSQQEHISVNALHSANRYHTIVNSQGEIMHVSDKIFQLDCIRKNKVSDTLEILKRLQTGECYSNIKTIQTELSYATMLNSVGGILEIVHVIESKK